MNKVFVYSKNKFREILSKIDGAVISIEGTPGRCGAEPGEEDIGL
jgi:hypothetical protein